MSSSPISDAKRRLVNINSLRKNQRSSARPDQFRGTEDALVEPVHFMPAKTWRSRKENYTVAARTDEAMMRQLRNPFDPEA
jgi:hypothetical protein